MLKDSNVLSDLILSHCGFRHFKSEKNTEAYGEQVMNLENGF